VRRTRDDVSLSSQRLSSPSPVSRAGTGWWASPTRSTNAAQSSNWWTSSLPSGPRLRTWSPNQPR